MRIVYSEHEKKRLDIFVSENLPDRSRSSIQKLIKAGGITVNGDPTSVHHWLKHGDVISSDEQIMLPGVRTKEPLPDPTIIFEDEDLMVVHKPAGLLTHPTEQKEPESLAAWLVKNNSSIAGVGDDPLRPGIVHRLDKDIGGVVVVAKTQVMFEHLKSLFQEREITKKYYGLVHGQVLNDRGEITTPLKRDKRSGRMVADSATEQGKSAHTVYTVISRFKNYTLLDIQILSGRTHQIRAHLFSIGHSIVGDRIYETRDVKKRDKKIHALYPLLFAYHISFLKPGGSTVSATLPLPDFFKKTLDTLKSL